MRRSIVAALVLLSGCGGNGSTTNGPTATADDAVVAEDATVLIDALANDLGDGLVISSFVVEGGGTAMEESAQIRYAPAPNQDGPAQIRYVIADASGNEDEAFISIVVTPQNDSPVGSADELNAYEDTVSLLDVLVNDLDVDGDSLHLVSVGASSNASVSIAGDAIDYEPDPDFSGVDSFSYILADADGEEATASVVVHVVSMLDAPVAFADAFTVSEDDVLAPLETLVANDTDIDGSQLSAVIAEPPAHGSLVLQQTGDFVYAPFADFFGTDTFSYFAFDGIQLSTPAIVTITVTAVGDAPTAIPDGYAVDMNASLTVAAAEGVLANDSDLDSAMLTASVATDVSHGVLALAADGSFDYTPDPGYSGPDGFTYTAEDGVLSATASVTIDVDGGSAESSAAGHVDFHYVDENGSISIAAPGVLGNDGGAGPLTAAVVTPPPVGTFELFADGAFNFTPPTDYFGVTSFKYAVSDGQSTSAPVTVWLEVLRDFVINLSVSEVEVVEDKTKTLVVSIDAIDSVFPPPEVLVGISGLPNDVSAASIVIEAGTPGTLVLKAGSNASQSKWKDISVVGTIGPRVRTASLRYRTRGAPGALDSTFGGHNWVDLGTSNDIASSIAAQPDGKVVIAGRAASETVVVRVTEDGDLDPTFATGGIFRTPGSGAKGLAVLPDGRILVTGNGGGVANLIRLTADGVVDPSFSNTSIDVSALLGYASGGASVARNLTVLSDGSFLHAGQVATPSGPLGYVAKYDQEGTPVATYGSNGFATFSWIGSGDSVVSFAADTSGRGVAFGKAAADFALVRFDANGFLDTTFNGTGKRLTSGVSGSARDVAVRATGVIVGVGSTSVSGTTRAFTYTVPEDGASGAFSSMASSSFAGDAADGVAIDSVGRALVVGITTRDLLLSRVGDFAFNGGEAFRIHNHPDSRENIRGDAVWFDPEGRIIVAGRRERSPADLDDLYFARFWN